jgi:hypothetical protein
VSKNLKGVDRMSSVNAAVQQARAAGFSKGQNINLMA